ncbi:methionyl-tRNA formyltransferase [uncultured Amnibacterium sp.]|uniref:methionyl-tRNA formyltransferase n=1 Tax=uncultured Amnibacterium sp. TaxID=1631851 RepID=UPI0035CB8194
MRLIFAGTPSAAVPSLQALIDGPHDVVQVVTRPPAPAGRRRTLTPSPVQRAAQQAALPVLTTARLGAEATERLTALQADLGVVVAYGALVRTPLLTAPRLGWLNLHFSLLPRWRGAAPVQRAVLAGDTESGVSVFRLEQGLDTGPLVATRAVPIGEAETAGELLDRLADIGAEVLRDAVDALAAGTAILTPQRGAPTLAPKLTAADGRIDWTLPADAVLARIRGATPEPGAVTDAVVPAAVVAGGAGVRLKVLRAAPVPASAAPGTSSIASEAPSDGAPLAPGAVLLRAGRVLAGTGSNPIELLTVQPAGRTGMPAAAWLRGLAAVPVLR